MDGCSPVATDEQLSPVSREIPLICVFVESSIDRLDLSGIRFRLATYLLQHGEGDSEAAVEQSRLLSHLTGGKKRNQLEHISS